MRIHFTAIFCCASLATALTSVAGAQTGPRQEIEKMYRRASEAARLRFLPGCISMRHPRFRATGPDGALVNIPAEQERLKSIFDNAVRVDNTTEVLSFRNQGPDRVICEVRDKLEFMVVGSVLKDGRTITLDTRTKDTWVRTPRGWQLLESAVVRQNTSERGAAPKVESRPLTPSPTP